MSKWTIGNNPLKKILMRLKFYLIISIMIPAFFFGHLALEKIIKGLVIKQINKAAPLIHDLERLALLAKLELSEEQIKHLRTITDFSIAGRYSEIKYNFYKNAPKNTLKKI